MKTMEELIAAVHARAGVLLRRRIASAGAASGALAVALMALIGRLGGLTHRPAPGGYAGASMLSDSAGGYVLAAVLAFMAGVMMTVALLRGRRKQTGPIRKGRENEEPEEEGRRPEQERPQRRES